MSKWSTNKKIVRAFKRRGTQTRRQRRPTALWPKANRIMAEGSAGNRIMAGGSAGQQHYGQRQRRQKALWPQAGEADWIGAGDLGDYQNSGCLAKKQTWVARKQTLESKLTNCDSMVLFTPMVCFNITDTDSRVLFFAIRVWFCAKQFFLQWLQLENQALYPKNTLRGYSCNGCRWQPSIISKKYFNGVFSNFLVSLCMTVIIHIH